MAETIRPANPTPPPPPADQVFDAAEATVGSLADKAAHVRDEASRVISNASERVADVGRQAADKVTATSEYFRDHDMKAVASDLKAYTREHPAQALIGAAALGFLAAVLIRRN